MSEVYMCIACMMQSRNACEILLRKCDRKILYCRTECRRRDKMKYDVRVLALVTSCCEHGNDSLGSVKGMGFTI
jgi:hypothetical protein